jgi:hypothetical protein
MSLDISDTLFLKLRYNLPNGNYFAIRGSPSINRFVHNFPPLLYNVGCSAAWVHFDSQEAHRASQGAIPHPRIDLRRGNLSMSQRPLDEVQVAGLFIKPGGESVAEGMERDWPVDSGFLEPLGGPELDLPGAQSLARLALKKRPVWACVGLCGVFFEELA